VQKNAPRNIPLKSSPQQRTADKADFACKSDWQRPHLWRALWLSWVFCCFCRFVEQNLPAARLDSGKLVMPFIF
jgi:hypothetical protein